MKKLITITLSLTLLACMQPAENPNVIADKYWQLLQSGNTVEAEKLVSTNSKQNITEHSDRIENISQLDNGETRTIVSTTIKTINPVSNASHSQTFDTVLVLQQGEWKIDINQSPIPPSPSATEEELQKLADDLKESVQENIESIDEAMSEGMQLLNEALREGSKEMGESLLDTMKKLNKSMHESIDNMKQRHKQEQQPKNTPGTTLETDNGEGIL